MTNKITFIIGGARSGKSEYALSLASKAKNVAFIATGQALDGEMAGRIKLHKKARPKNWQTFEEPANVSSLLKNIPSGYDMVIIDCMTLLVSNLLLKKIDAGAIEKEAASMMNELNRRRGKAIVVSNEVGLGIVPGNKLSRNFRDIAGRVNRIVAEKSARVVFVVSGIPWRIK